MCISSDIFKFKSYEKRNILKMKSSRKTRVGWKLMVGTAACASTLDHVWTLGVKV
jgi:hypothetical protein